MLEIFYVMRVWTAGRKAKYLLIITFKQNLVVKSYTLHYDTFRLVQTMFTIDLNKFFFKVVQ